MIMRLDELFARKERTLSIEFFPPKSERGWHTLEDTIDQLVPLGPDFVSVTYGAGGGTREKTREVVVHLQQKAGVTAMAHLTCVNATRADLQLVLDEYAAAGVQNLLALRGDPPKGQERFTPVDGGCAHAGDLIHLIRQDGRFAVACAAFPEKHPDAPSRESDWGHLHGKFQKGACAALTQCFFEPAPYFELMAWLEKETGRKPRIIPGILPIVDYAALKRFCNLCGARIPERLSALLDPLEGNPVAMRKAGIAYSVAFARELLERGAPGLHLYALNRSTAAAELITALRLSGHLE